MVAQLELDALVIAAAGQVGLEQPLRFLVGAATLNSQIKGELITDGLCLQREGVELLGKQVCVAGQHRDQTILIKAILRQRSHGGVVEVLHALGGCNVHRAQVLSDGVKTALKFFVDLLGQLMDRVELGAHQVPMDNVGLIEQIGSITQRLNQGNVTSSFFVHFCHLDHHLTFSKAALRSQCLLEKTVEFLKTTYRLQTKTPEGTRFLFCA